MLVVAARNKDYVGNCVWGEFYDRRIFDFRTVKVGETPLIEYILPQQSRKRISDDSILQSLCQSPQFFKEYADSIFSRRCKKWFLTWLIERHPSLITTDHFKSILSCENPVLLDLWLLVHEGVQFEPSWWRGF